MVFPESALPEVAFDAAVAAVPSPRIGSLAGRPAYFPPCSGALPSDSSGNADPSEGASNPVFT